MLDSGRGEIDNCLLERPEWEVVRTARLNALASLRYFQSESVLIRGSPRQQNEVPRDRNLPRSQLSDDMLFWQQTVGLSWANWRRALERDP